MYSVEEISNWPLSQIYAEIADQKDWIRETRRTAPGFDCSNACEYRDRLYQAITIINNRRG